MKFIKVVSKIVKLVYNLLGKDAAFNFHEACHETFSRLKVKLISAPVIASMVWSQPFKLMCDDYVIGAVIA